MGVFASKVGQAKTAFGANYGREGRYWVIINSGKEDVHVQKKSPQIIFEGTVIRVVDPGPAAGQRYKTTKGGNETPHAPGDPYTLHFGSWQLGAEGRLRHFLLVATGTEERDLPPSVDPRPPYSSLAVPPGTQVPGAPAGVLSVNPVEFATDQCTSPTVNALKNKVVEVLGRGTKTQGRGPAGAQDIIAIDPVRRVWARDIHEVWESLHENAKLELMKDKRLEGMLKNEENERAAATAPK